MTEAFKNIDAQNLFPSHSLYESEPDLSGVSLTSRHPITISDFATSVRQDLDGEVLARYKELGEERVYCITIKDEELGEDYEEVVIFGPQLTASQLNNLLFCAATYKDYNYDTADIINDWTDLYEKPIHVERRERHAAMPGWANFEKSRELIIGMLTRNWDEYHDSFQLEDQNDVIIPVIHCLRGADGGMVLSVDALTNRVKKVIMEYMKYMPGYIPDEERLDVGMGIMLLAAYSPAQTKWSEYIGYSDEDTEEQVLGPTQVLAYAMRRIVEKQQGLVPVPDNQDLQQSPMLLGLVKYAVTGVNEREDQSSKQRQEKLGTKISGKGNNQVYEDEYDSEPQLEDISDDL